MRFADAPVRVRWIFTTKSMSTRSAVSLEELRHVERYMRLQAFQIRPRTEALVEVDAPASPPAAAATFADRVARQTGSITSELPVRVPESLPPGLYSVQATVELAGVEAEGSALFEVVAMVQRGGP